MPASEPMRKSGTSRFAHAGFTLIELIVVIALISIMLLFSVPRFRNTVLTDNTKKVSRWIMAKAASLKEKAPRENKRYILHVGLDNNRMWITHETMSEEEIQEAERNGYTLPDDVRLLAVDYPLKGRISAGRGDISFYRQGHSDKALIHIIDDDNRRLALLIEPFLSEVKLRDNAEGFND